MSKKLQYILIGFVAIVLSMIIAIFSLMRLISTSIPPMDTQVNAQVQAKESKNMPTELAKNARAAALLDYHTGTFVFEKNPNEHYPIASMVKIMTLNCIFDAINNGQLSIDSDITISENAAGMGGSQALLDANSVYKANELIKSIVVASANDSCVALAEHISGSVENFVQTMNAKATELGMKNTNFVNCTGLPAEGAYSSAYDVGIMMRALLKHREFYDYAKVWMYEIEHPGGRKTILSNTNKLIKGYNGCDGGKTGFTNEAMYCLAATAKRGDTRLIAITMGEKDSKVRNFETSSLLNYGFANYETKKVVDNTKELQDTIWISKGKTNELKIAPKDDCFVFFKKTSNDKMTQTIQIEKFQAPIQRGDKVGEMQILQNGEKIATVDLIATMDIQESSYFDLLNKVLQSW